MDIVHLITSEAHLERYLRKNWNNIFDFSFKYARKKIGKRSVIDIIGVHLNRLYILELKYRPIRKSDRKQLKRYIKSAKIYFGSNFDIIGLFVGYYHHKTLIYIKRY